MKYLLICVTGCHGSECTLCSIVSVGCTVMRPLLMSCQGILHMQATLFARSHMRAMFQINQILLTPHA
jgi:hypothetical protein